MVGRKQRFRTALLIIILAAAIVGGVFAVSYFTDGVTFPWEVATEEQKPEEPAAEPEKEEPKLVVKEKKQDEAAKKEEELKKAKEEADKKAKEEAEKKAAEEEAEAANAIIQTGYQMDCYGALHVEDGKLVDAKGNVAVLTGVSTDNFAWYPNFASEDAIKFLHLNWGVNVIRLSLFTSDYQGYCVAGEDNQETLKNLINDAVDAATNNDMYIILDWHNLNDGNPNEYKSEAIQFFGEMVRKYKSSDNVIYEICNEANGDTTWDDVKAYAKEVIPVIRRVDKDALILVGTPDGCTDLDSALNDPLEFDNVMYTYHFHAGTNKSSERNAITNAVEDGLPVFISQYSYLPVDGGDVDKHEATRWNDLIDEYGLSSCVWSLSNSDDGAGLIKESCEKYYDFAYEDLSAYGQYFFDRINNLDRRNSSNDN